MRYYCCCVRVLPINKNGVEKKMNADMRNVKSQQDFDEPFQLDGDKVIVVHLFSPSCRACKTLSCKVRNTNMHILLRTCSMNQ